MKNGPLVSANANKSGCINPAATFWAPHKKRNDRPRSGRRERARERESIHRRRPALLCAGFLLLPGGGSGDAKRRPGRASAETAGPVDQ